MPPPHRAQSLSRPATRTPPIAIIGTNASISSAFLKIKLGWPPGFDSLSEVAAFTGSSAESKSVAVNKVNTIPPPHRAQSLSRPATRTPPIAIIGTMHQSLQPSSKIKIAKAPTRHSDPRNFPPAFARETRPGREPDSPDRNHRQEALISLAFLENKSRLAPNPSQRTQNFPPPSNPHPIPAASRIPPIAIIGKKHQSLQPFSKIMPAGGPITVPAQSPAHPCRHRPV